MRPKTDTLARRTTEKGGAYGHQRNQEMRTSSLYVSGHCGELLQPAVRDDGRNPGRGLQVPSLRLHGQNGIRSPRIVIENALTGIAQKTNCYLAACPRFGSRALTDVCQITKVVSVGRCHTELEPILH
jgi:hypothetical protein